MTSSNGTNSARPIIQFPSGRCDRR
jgi:hypothetical protein